MVSFEIVLVQMLGVLCVASLMVLFSLSCVHASVHAPVLTHCLTLPHTYTHTLSHLVTLAGVVPPAAPPPPRGLCGESFASVAHQMVSEVATVGPITVGVGHQPAKFKPYLAALLKVCGCVLDRQCKSVMCV